GRGGGAAVLGPAAPAPDRAHRGAAAARGVARHRRAPAPRGDLPAGAGGAPVQPGPRRGPVAERGTGPVRMQPMRIALFVTCLADTLFPDVGKSTTVLLERLGHRVEFPEGQTCCGQMHVNTGYQREALPLIRRYVETFEPYDVVVAPSGSCVGSIRHQHAMVARRHGDASLADRAEAVAGRT